MPTSIQPFPLAEGSPLSPTKYTFGGRARSAGRPFFEQLQWVRSPPKIPEWERITAVITRRVDQLVRGDRTLDATVQTLDSDVDQILEKRRWLLQRQAGAAARDAGDSCGRLRTAAS